MFSEHRESLVRCRHRTFFSTCGERVGLRPADIRTGDTVYVLYGGAKLYVLRFLEGGKLAEVIGDAYLDGCMTLSEMDGSLRGANEYFAII